MLEKYKNYRTRAEVETSFIIVLLWQQSNKHKVVGLTVAD